MSRQEMKNMSETYVQKINALLCSGEICGLPWEYLKDCLNESQDLKQVTSLKQFGAVLKKQAPDAITPTEKDLCCEILTQVLVTIDPKGTLHRAIASILQSFPDGDQEFVSTKLGGALGVQLLSCPRTNAKDCRKCVDAISGLLENFPLGEKCLSSVFVQVVTFLHEALEAFMQCTRCIKDAIGQNEAMYNCLAAVKTIIAVIQKCFQHKSLVGDVGNIQGLMKAIVHTVWSILSNGSYLADCRSAAGIALVLLLRSLVTHDGYQLSSVIYSALFCHLSATNIQPSPSHQPFQFDTANLPTQSYLYVCHGVLAMLDSKDLMDGRLPLHGQCLLLHVLFPEILTLTERLTDPSSALTASRTLTLWTTAAVVAVTSGCHDNSEVNLLGSAEIPQKLIQYVWTNWDHPIDGIRYQTKSIFENVLQLHVIVKGTRDYKPNDDPFLLGLLDSLVAVNWHVRGKYMPLGCLVTHLGAEQILGLHPTMPRELLVVFGDQTLAPYACDLLERLFTNHKSFLTSVGQGTDGLERWQTIWIVPFLEFLCSPSTSKDQKTYLIEYYIPRLLKCSPETLTFIITHLHRDKRDSPSSLDKPGQLGALVTCLKTARSMGLVKYDGKCEGGAVQPDASLWKGLVPYAKLKEALCHKESRVRIDALGLLCDCNKTTEPVSSKELSLLQFFLVLNINSVSPSFRQQMGAHLKKLFIRLRESGRVYLKQMTKQLEKETPDNSTYSPEECQIKAYKGFMSWLMGLFSEALQPGCSFPRRTVALYTLRTMAQIYSCKSKDLKSSFFDLNAVWTPDHILLLLHRLSDPYESNKVIAFDLLSDLSQETLGLMDHNFLHQFYQDARHLASSNRPHNCETASFMLRLIARQLTQPLKRAAADLPQSIMGILTDLCANLSEEVDVAKGSLLEAAVQGPMYGTLHCIRELLADVDPRTISESEVWNTMVTRLIKLCLDVADAASVVVCNSSPEGYIPEETDDDLENSGQMSDHDGNSASSQSTNTAGKALKVTSQMVLVCCWRSMKEVSLLMGKLALSAPLSVDNSPGLISKEQLEEIGNFFLRLLKESKHRGAFELAYTGFIMLTTRLWKSEVASLGQLPQQWLRCLLSDITNSQSMLCATRRSAGIPFAIQALVSSEPSTQGKSCFQQAMTTLLSLAFPSSSSSEAVTSQVHALNILRVLYKDSHLGEDVIPYIADGVRASIIGFAARLWGVRNSSTLLFSALVTRIFGVQRAKQDHDRRNCMTGKEFFARFPALHPFLLLQLKEATSVDTRSGMARLHPSLFPVLLLLSRLYPSPMDGAHTRLSMDHFVPYVLGCASSAVYKTRSIAARALVPLVPANRQVNMLKDLIGLLPRAPDAPAQHNHIHGVLLQILELLECILLMSVSKQEMPMPLTDVLCSLADFIWLASKANRCLVTRAVFLEILDAVLFENTLLVSTCNLHENPLKHLRIKVASIAADEIQTTSFKSRAALHEPGFITLQLICASICLKWVFLCERMKASSPIAEISHDDLRKESGKTSRGERIGQQQSPAENNPEIEQNSGDQPKACIDDKGQLSSLDTILIGLLSSPIYEVRLLTLNHLIQSIEGCPSERTMNNHLQTTVASSCRLYQKLVVMVTEEEHEVCLIQVYELLSYHPMTCQSPWQLPGHQITCAECFQAAIVAASQPKQREDLISSIVKFTSCLVPIIYCELQSAECGTVKLLYKLLSDWSVLLDQCSMADQTVHSRLTVVKAIDKLAAIVLMDQSTCLGNIPFMLWGFVLRLLQDDDLEVQQGAMSCIRKVALKMDHSSVSDLYHMDTQPSLGLHLGLHLFIMLFIQRCPRSCVQSLVEWGIGAVQEASTEHCEELEDERLFDQGEANTNFEGVFLAKIISKQLHTLAKTTQLKMPSCPEDQTVPNVDSSQEPSTEKSTLEEPSQRGMSGQLKTRPTDCRLQIAVCDSETIINSGDVPQSGTSQDGQQMVIGHPSSALKRGPNPEIGRMLETDLDILLKGEDCIDAGFISRLELSESTVQQLQTSSRDGLLDVAARLEESLQVWPAASPFLNTGEWEMQTVSCCRILLCCHALTGFLPCNSVASLATRLSPLLEDVRERFCRDGEASCSLLVKAPLQGLSIWCGLGGGR